MSYKKLHYSSLVLDSHCDTPSLLTKGYDLSKRLRRGHFDFYRMREGGVDAVFFAIYTSGNLEPDASTTKALQLISAIYDTLEDNSDIASLTLDREEALLNKEKGIASVFLGMENGAPIQKDLSLLRLFYDMGVRYMTLTHSADNEICDSSSSVNKRWGGLSSFGKEVVKEMNRIGMLIDVSHISDDSFFDVIKYSSKPVVASHSCCRALADHPRNLSDEMIQAVASNGGVIQINFYPPFLDSDYAKVHQPLLDTYEELKKKMENNPKEYTGSFKSVEKKLLELERPSYTRVVDHIDHVVKIAGVDYVGLGSDFDGIEVTPAGLEGINKMPVITMELLRRGYKEESIRKILGLNFLRLLK